MSRLRNVALGGLVALNIASCGVAVKGVMDARSARRELQAMKDAVGTEAVITAFESRMVSDDSVPMVGDCTAREQSRVFELSIQGTPAITLPVCSSPCGEDSLAVGPLLGFKAENLAKLTGNPKIKEAVRLVTGNEPAEVCPSPTSGSEEPPVTEDEPKPQTL